MMLRLFVLAFAATTAASGTELSTGGPYGPLVRPIVMSVAVAPSAPNIVYALSMQATAQLYRSLDGGESRRASHVSRERPGIGVATRRRRRDVDGIRESAADEGRHRRSEQSVAAVRHYRLWYVRAPRQCRRRKHLASRCTRRSAVR